MDKAIKSMIMYNHMTGAKIIYDYLNPKKVPNNKKNLLWRRTISTPSDLLRTKTIYNRIKYTDVTNTLDNRSYYLIEVDDYGRVVKFVHENNYYPNTNIERVYDDDYSHIGDIARYYTEDLMFEYFIVRKENDTGYIRLVKYDVGDGSENGKISKKPISENIITYVNHSSYDDLESFGTLKIKREENIRYDYYDDGQCSRKTHTIKNNNDSRTVIEQVVPCNKSSSKLYSSEIIKRYVIKGENTIQCTVDERTFTPDGQLSHSVRVIYDLDGKEKHRIETVYNEYGLMLSRDKVVRYPNHTHGVPSPKMESEKRTRIWTCDYTFYE